MQDPQRTRRRQPARTAAASILVLVGLFGVALAQQTGSPAQATRPQAQQQPMPQQPAPPEPPANPFGSLPEPPTEHLPPPSVLDPANADYRRLQQPQEAFSTLPKDKRGKPDWMRALRENTIQPRAGVLPGQSMQSLDLDIVMKNTAQMPFVRFPHKEHTMWLACSNCHDAIFAPKAGANAIDMTKIYRGQACGVCHTSVAFTAMFACERCHSVLQPGQKPWW